MTITTHNSVDTAANIPVRNRFSDPAGPEFYTRITPTRGWASLRLKELWDYRELLFFLAWRDVKVRYKQTFLGVAWAILVPLLTMVVFNVLFGLLMGAEGKPTLEGVPYAIAAYTALVPWQMFANSMGQSSTSLVTNRNMITKVYFPRLIAPLAPILSALVDFLIAFAILFVLIAVYHVSTDFHFTLSWRLLALPLFVLLSIITALSLSLWLSAANALYRDVRYVIPFLVQNIDVRFTGRLYDQLNYQAGHTGMDPDRLQPQSTGQACFKDFGGHCSANRRFQFGVCWRR